MNIDDYPSTRGDIHRLLDEDPRFALCGLRRDESGRWIPEPLEITVMPEEVTCRECKRRQEIPIDKW